MVTALTVYGLTTASTTLTTADTLGTTTGGALTNRNSTVGTNTGYGEIRPPGTSGWAASGSIGNPSGRGLLLDSVLLEGEQIVAGNWTPTLQLAVSLGSLRADLYIRAYVRSHGGTYTQIGSNMVLAGQTLTTATTSYVFSATSQALANFNSGDKLYIDIWANVLTNSTGSSSAVIKLFLSTSATQGNANMQIVTPGYIVQPTQPVPPFYGILQFHGQDTNSPAYPTPPWGSYTPTSNSNATNSNIVGAVLPYTWAQIETAEGTYNWSLIDNDIALWSAQNKYVQLRIFTGGTFNTNNVYHYNNTASQATPQWVFDAGCTKLTEADGTVYPVYWDSVYKSKYSTFVAAFGARYDAHDSVIGIAVGVGCFGETVVDETSASTAAKVALWCNGGTVYGPNTAFSNGTAAYTHATWNSFIQWAITQYQTAFPTTSLQLMVNSSFLMYDGTYNQNTAIADAVSASIWLEDNGLTSTNTHSNAAWNTTPHYEEQLKSTVVTGDTLAGDLANAITLQGQFAVIYTVDINNAAYATALAQYAALAIPYNPKAAFTAALLLSAIYRHDGLLSAIERSD